MNKKNIYCILNGGIGNQLFQYSFSKYISQRNFRSLYFISKNMILFNLLNDKDKKLKKLNLINSFGNKVNLLSLLGIKINTCSLLFNILYLIIPLLKKFYNINSSSISFFNFQIFVEQNRGFDKEIFDKILNSKTKNIILYGYWQSHKYFPIKSQSIIPNFQNISFVNKNFEKIFNKIKYSNSVGVCIRVYEDVPGNENTFKVNRKIMGGIPDLNYYKKIISNLRDKLNTPNFFIFSSKNFSFFSDLQLSKDDYFINNDTGYKGTVDNLILMSNCKHLVISHSSYYWWASMLGNSNNQIVNIYRPYNKKKDLTNIDYYPNEWVKVDY